jgi:hypothetical protein
MVLAYTTARGLCDLARRDCRVMLLGLLPRMSLPRKTERAGYRPFCSSDGQAV